MRGHVPDALKFTRLTQFVTWVGLEWCFTFWFARHGNFLLAGEAWKFTLISGFAGVAYWLAASTHESGAERAEFGLWWIWAVAIALRLAMFPCFPGDDIWRYRWEGAIQLHGFNPFLDAPDSQVLSGLRDFDWTKINHRDYPAIYPPLAQWVFAGLASLGNSIWSYKLLFTLADLAGVALLTQLAGRARAAWFAWNPLVVYCSAGAAHFDCLMVLVLLGMILLLDGDDPHRLPGSKLPLPQPRPGGTLLRRPWSRDLAAALLLGTAIGIKVAPAVLVPVWMFAVGNWKRAAILLPAVAAPSLIPAIWFGFPRVPVFAALGHFGRDFRVNEPVWWLWEAFHLSGLGLGSGLLPAISLLVCAALAWVFRRDWRRGLLWTFGAALLLSPIVHAWYVVWILPLAAWRGRAARPWFVLSISVSGYFLLWQVNPPGRSTPWIEPIWLRLLIYGPPVLALAWTALSVYHLRTRTGQSS